MTQPVTGLNLFVTGEIQKVRNFSGPQYADDPTRLLQIMQAAAMQFQDEKLTPQQKQNLYQHFQTEAQQYRQQFHQYIQPSAYDGVLADIKALIERLF